MFLRLARPSLFHWGGMVQWLNTVSLLQHHLETLCIVSPTITPCGYPQSLSSPQCWSSSMAYTNFNSSRIWSLCCEVFSSFLVHNSKSRTKGERLGIAPLCHPIFSGDPLQKTDTKNCRINQQTENSLAAILPWKGHVPSKKLPGSRNILIFHKMEHSFHIYLWKHCA